MHTYMSFSLYFYINNWHYSVFFTPFLLLLNLMSADTLIVMSYDKSNKENHRVSGGGGWQGRGPHLAEI